MEDVISKPSISPSAHTVTSLPGSDQGAVVT